MGLGFRVIEVLGPRVTEGLGFWSTEGSGFRVEGLGVWMGLRYIMGLRVGDPSRWPPIQVNFAL